MRGVSRLDMASARVRSEVGGPAGVVASWRAIRATLLSAPPLRVTDLAVGGRDLMRIGVKPGPLLGRTLEGLLDWVLEDPDRNEFDLLLDRVREVLERSAAEAVEPFEDEGL